MKRLGYADVAEKLERFVRDPMCAGRTLEEVADMATRHLRLPIKEGWVMIACGHVDYVLNTRTTLRSIRR